MYTELILFRNELKNKSVPKYKIIGIVAELLLSKEVFHTNLEIEDFLKQVFDLQFKVYVFRSRTLVVARVIRVLLAIENDSSYKNNLYKFVQSKIDVLKDDTQNRKNQLDGWM